MPFSGALILSDKDNVATTLEDIEAGAKVAVRLGGGVTSIEALVKISFGFKVAVAGIAKGSHVIKYGQSIGIASPNIKCGELVYTHNLEGGRGRGDLEKGGAR